MRRTQAAHVFAAMTITLIAAQALAHEFWVEPSTYTPKVNEVVRVALKHGERFDGHDVPRQDAMILDFSLKRDQADQPVVGRAGMSSSFVRPEDSGTHIISYQSKRYRNELSARDFEHYLLEEGLGHISERRIQLGQTDQPGREVYSRCSKSIIVAGDSDSTGHDLPLGLPLEITPIEHPCALRPEAVCTLRIDFNGRPLKDARVVAVNEHDPSQLAVAATNGEGHAQFKLNQSGAWLFTTIHMIEAPEGLDAQWESFWASLTFCIADRSSMNRKSEHHMSSLQQ